MLLAFILGDTFGSDPSDPLNNISLLLTAFGRTVQALEAAGQQVLTQRTLDDAVGVLLDEIGVIVGQPRNGLDDDTYRRYCRAAIAAHRSNGVVEDILRVANFIVFDPAATYAVIVQSTATIDVRVGGIALSDALARVLVTFLERTAASGVRVMVTYGSSVPATWFRFNSGPGFNQGHLVGRIE